MSLLSICQDAASQLGLRQPSAIVGSTDLTAQILLRFAQQAGKELSKYHGWQNLTFERTFTSLAQEEQTDALGGADDDFDRMVYNAEIWNRTTNLRYTFPTPQRMWQRLKSAVGGGVTGYARILRNELHIYPAPTAGQTIAFEVISKHWNESAAGDGQERWMADTDVGRIPEHLFILEIVWRYRHSRGFAQYAEDMETCEREKEKAASQDRGTGRIRPEGASSSDWPPQPSWSGSIDS